jgi:hypothetical protein
MRRSQQTPTAAKQRGNLNDSPSRSAGHHHYMAPIASRVRSESQYRLRHFIIGIAVLCALFFGCFDLLLFSTNQNRSDSSGRQGEGEQLPTCASKHSSSEWKATLMAVSRTQSDTQDTQSSRSDTAKDEKKLLSKESSQNVDRSNRTILHDRNGIRHNPRMLYDLTHLSTLKESQQSQQSQQFHSSESANQYCADVTPDAGVCVKESDKLGLRCLPSFLIIGTLNSGGNHLMKWLNKHPNLQSGDNSLYFTPLHFILLNFILLYLTLIYFTIIVLHFISSTLFYFNLLYFATL